MTSTVTVPPQAARTVKLDPTSQESRPHPSLYKTIDGLFRGLASEAEDIPIFGYPCSSIDDFEVHTAKTMSRYIDAACWWYESQGLKAANPDDDQAPVMALLTQSGLDAVVTFLALNRMGWAVLFLSTRLTAAACVALMEQAKCKDIIVGSTHEAISQEMSTLMQLHSMPRIKSQDYRSKANTTPYNRSCDLEKESRKLAWIIHSSGSTGHPKPIFITNFGCLANFRTGLGFRSFTVSPLFHSHALMEFGRAVYAKQPIFCGNYAFPVTSQNLISAMRVAKPKTVCAVPYVLKLLAEKNEGIAELAKATVVMSGGSAVPDVLGDQLTAAGIHLCSNYGATETGFIMNSYRDRGDPEWAYLRLKKPVDKYVLMDEISPGVFECVALDGLPSKDTTNSDSPPNSFRTRDLFTRHPDPAKSNYWKYLSRLDDRLTLVNGEKVLPIPIEGHIRQHDLIKEAVVFGFQREVPGVILFKSEKASSLPNDAFIKAVWPQIEMANSQAETFSHIPRDLIVVFPETEVYPRTDKGTAIRAQCYEKYAAMIEQAYQRFETGTITTGAVLLKADKPSQIEDYLLEKFRAYLGTPLESPTSDIFSAGVDSLQTARLCNAIRKEIDLGGNQAKLSQNAVYERGTVRSLAQHLYNLRCGIDDDDQEDELAIMQGLIDKYSSFTPHQAVNQKVVSAKTFLLTGVTGGLGSHLLADLVQKADVARVYCLVRATSKANAQDRVIASLSSRSLHGKFERSALDKIVALPSDLSQSTLGLEQDDLTEMLSSLTTIIHSAWAVNFNIPLLAFEQQHIRGVYNLIEHVALRTTHAQPAEFYFCSSISAASGTPKPATIAEKQIIELSHAQHMGYGRSKLVAERITNMAMRATDMQSRVLRIGQLAGDSVNGVWNDTEAIALMIRSALPQSAGCLPALSETPSWLPIDVAAKTIEEIIYAANNAQPTDTAFHILNPCSFSYSQQLLPMLSSHPDVPAFSVVPVEEWLERLRQSNDDVNKNPSKKLLDFWLAKYGSNKLNASAEDDAPAGLTFETTRSQELSTCLAKSEDPVSSGLMYKIVSVWMSKWKGTK